MPVNPGASLSGDGGRHARHLLRRAGFGVTKKEYETFVKKVVPQTRGAAADYLLDFTAKAFKPGGSNFDGVHNKWLKNIIKIKTPLHEKLTLFWHDHFATGYSKLLMELGERDAAKHMSLHIALLHLHAKGNFRDFVKAIGKNAAMMQWLDTVRNSRGIPNENYGRELLELFTVGVYDFAATPQPNYTQDDIVQIARAFTGWRYEEGSLKPFLREERHDFMDDFPERGPKVIFQTTGGFGGAGRDFADQGEGAIEIDRVVDHIFDHTSDGGKNTVARRIAYRLCEYFAHGEPSLAGFVDEVVDDSGFDTSFDIAALVRSIFTHDDFYLTANGPPYTVSSKKSVKWPVDFVAGTMRMLGSKAKGGDLVITNGNYRPLVDHLYDMGQLIVDPPSVFGWDWETAWLSSQTLLARYTFARDVCTARDSSSRFKPEKLMSLGLTDPNEIVTAVTDILGVTQTLRTEERDILLDYLTDGGAVSSINLGDFDVRHTKLFGLFTLVMQSPAYQLH